MDRPIALRQILRQARDGVRRRAQAQIDSLKGARRLFVEQAHEVGGVAFCIQNLPLVAPPQIVGNLGDHRGDDDGGDQTDLDDQATPGRVR